MPGIPCPPYPEFTYSIPSAIVGPVTYGVVTLLTQGNHRLAIVSTALFFVVGLVLLVRVDVERGIAAARSASGSIATP